MYKCSYCHLTSKKKWKIQVHETRKHKSDSRAPNVMSVGPNGPRAPTTVSVPPQQMGVQYGSGVQAATSHQHAYNPHPYVHPYLNNANQQPNTYPQRTPRMAANNMYYTEETRAPPKISVGPRAPTTVSVPPQTGGVQQGYRRLIS